MPDPCICEKKECDLLELLEQKFSQQEALIRELLDRPIAEGPAFPKGHGLSQRWRPRALGSTSTSDEAESKETVSRQGSKESKEEAQKVIEEAFVTERDDEGPELTPANRKKKRNTVLAAVMTEKWAPEPPFRAFVRTRLDAYMGIVVMLNIFVMIVMTQWSGRNSEVKLGLAPEGWPWFTQQFFDLTEYCRLIPNRFVSESVKPRLDSSGWGLSSLGADGFELLGK
ncbi:unnamed protein product [Effrenium voratum]|nr:unnamed protein product [Effrenium voratum]